MNELWGYLIVIKSLISCIWVCFLNWEIFNVLAETVTGGQTRKTGTDLNRLVRVGRRNAVLCDGRSDGRTEELSLNAHKTALRRHLDIITIFGLLEWWNEFDWSRLTAQVQLLVNRRWLHTFKMTQIILTLTGNGNDLYLSTADGLKGKFWSSSASIFGTNRLRRHAWVDPP